jgi:hypothetical protein
MKFSKCDPSKMSEWEFFSATVNVNEELHVGINIDNYRNVHRHGILLKKSQLFLVCLF